MKRIAIVAGAVTLAVVAAWYLALWSPANASLRTANRQLQAAQDDRLTALSQKNDLTGMLHRLSAEVIKASALTEAAPMSAQIPEMIDQVSALAAASGVTLGGESQTEPANSATPAAAGSSGSAGSATAVPTVTLTMSVRGTYYQLLDFISRLQTAPRLLKVSTLSLSGSGGGSVSTTTGGAPASAPLGDSSGVMSTTVNATMYLSTTALPSPPRITTVK